MKQNEEKKLKRKRYEKKKPGKEETHQVDKNKP